MPGSSRGSVCAGVCVFLTHAWKKRQLNLLLSAFLALVSHTRRSKHHRHAMDACTLGALARRRRSRYSLARFAYLRASARDANSSRWYHGYAWTVRHRFTYSLISVVYAARPCPGLPPPRPWSTLANSDTVAKRPAERPGHSGRQNSSPGAHLQVAAAAGFGFGMEQGRGRQSFPQLARNAAAVHAAAPPARAGRRGRHRGCKAVEMGA